MAVTQTLHPQLEFSTHLARVPVVVVLVGRRNRPPVHLGLSSAPEFPRGIPANQSLVLKLDCIQRGCVEP
jgi:hypothetical protein